MFIFDANVTTPAELAKRRRMAQALLDRGAGGVANNIGDGLAQLGSAIAGRIKMSGVDREENTYRSRATDLLMNALGGAGSGAAPVSGGGEVPSGLFGDAGADELQGGTGPVSLTNYAGNDWLRYSNQGATRNKPISGKLAKSLGFLKDMGVSAEVFSGGQDAAGQRRTGSRRHDHGNAADVFFSKDGRRLSWADPKDVPLYQEIVRRARANGVTGFGAGPGYMPQGSMHIGFGTPAVWGRGGRGENAPEWLTAAFNGAAPAPLANMGNPGMDRLGAPVPAPAPMGTAMAGFPPQQAEPQAPPPVQQPVPQVVPVAGPAPMQAAPTAYDRQMRNAMERGTASEAVARQMRGQPMRQGAPAMAAAPAPAQGAPAMPQAAPATPGISLGSLQQAIGSPYFAYLDPSQQKFILDEYERQFSLANPDPMKELQRRKLEMEIGQMGQPKPTVLNPGQTVFDGQKAVFTAPEQAKPLEPNKTRTIEQGAEQITQEFDPATGQWSDVSRAPRWNPNPSSQTTVNVGGGTDKQIFDETKERAAAARAAYNGLNSLRQAGKALDGAITGAAANQRLDLQKIAALFGVGDVDAIENTETFRSAIAPQVAAMLKATVGSTQVSNADREFAEKAAAGAITLDKRSIERLTRIMTVMNSEVVRSFNRDLETVYPSGSGFDRERALFNVPMVPKEYGQPLGPNLPQSAQRPAPRDAFDISPPPAETPSSPMTTAADPDNPRPGDMVDGFRFKGGDPSKEENWEIVR